MFSTPPDECWNPLPPISDEEWEKIFGQATKLAKKMYELRCDHAHEIWFKATENLIKEKDDV